MKRSEMIRELMKWGKYAPYPKTDEEAVDVVLRRIEELGMLPPPIPKSPLGKIKNRCRWEPEHE